MKEIYEMLRKAGVIADVAFPHLPTRDWDVWLKVDEHIKALKEEAYQEGWDGALDEKLDDARTAHREAVDFLKFWLCANESVDCPSCHCLLRDPPTDPSVSDHHKTCRVARILRAAP